DEVVDSSATKDHDASYNLFKEPFPNLVLRLKVKNFAFKKYKLADIIGSLNVKENHYIHTNKLQFKTAGGLVEIKGYINASNPQQIYLNPYLKFQQVDMDQLFIKLDNFGQDMLVSDNVHGLLTGKIKGIIKLHTDLTPILNKADLQMDFRLENGRLDNFAPMQVLSGYFGNKNLNRIRFDTLENRFLFKNGQLSFPNMHINSSLGYIELSGTQHIDKHMDYYIRVPLKLVGNAAFNKLFKRKPTDISPDQEDELIIKDPTRRTRFVNVRIVGKPDDYKISLQKNKDIKKGNSANKMNDFLFKELTAEFENEE
ncbi:MAG: AsmA-like C-terminal region-containing protein, partial [Chitinophagaceae bacterium]